MTASTDTRDQIAQAITSVTEEVPALRQLKLVFSVELRGRGDVQQYRVELPGPTITKALATDARVNVEMRREFFNAMVDEGARVADWREAFHYGQAKATGVPQLLKLIERVVDMHEERSRLRRAKQH
jgi:predicted nucleic acid-binding Zn ribbon protein